MTLLSEIERRNTQLDRAELTELRKQIGLWIEAVACARAASGLALRELRGSQDATRAYASVANTG